MPRLFGISAQATRWSFAVPLDSNVTLRDFLGRASHEITGELEKAVAREPGTYFENIRIAVDRTIVRSDDYDALVGPDSTVTIMAPYIDG